MEKKTIRKCVNIAPPSICLIFSRGGGDSNKVAPPQKKSLTVIKKKCHDMYFLEPLILSFEVGVRKGVISGGDRPQRLKGGGGRPPPPDAPHGDDIFDHPYPLFWQKRG